jgi:hypothetical protein
MKQKKMSENNTGFKGKHHTERTKDKMQKAKTGENNPMFGKHFTHSSEAKEKISNMKKGINNPNYGKHLSQEEKEHLKVVNTGKKHTKETIEKISLSRIGKLNPRAKKIMCMETNELFYSIADAVRKYSISKHKIIKCCQVENNTAGGYHWKYF